MSFATYADFGTAIARWLDVNPTALAPIADLITVAETRIFREARTKEMEVSISSAIASGVVAVPADYVAMKHAYLDGSPTRRLERRPVEWIYGHYPTRSANGTPTYFSREAGNFIFGPYPNSAFTFKGTYYKRLAAISVSLNALFTANPDLYLFACLAESEIVIGRDKRIQIWEAKYRKILTDVNGEDSIEKYSGSSLQTRAA